MSKMDSLQSREYRVNSSRKNYVKFIGIFYKSSPVNYWTYVSTTWTYVRHHRHHVLQLLIPNCADTGCRLGGRWLEFRIAAYFVRPTRLKTSLPKTISAVIVGHDRTLSRNSLIDPDHSCRRWEETYSRETDTRATIIQLLTFNDQISAWLIRRCEGEVLLLIRTEKKLSSSYRNPTNFSIRIVRLSRSAQTCVLSVFGIILENNIEIYWRCVTNEVQQTYTLTHVSV